MSSWLFTTSTLNHLPSTLLPLTAHGPNSSISHFVRQDEFLLINTLL